MVFKPHVNRLLFRNIVLLHLTAENSVIVALSLVGEVRGQHVEEVGAQRWQTSFPLVITSCRGVQVDSSQSYVINTTFPLGYERSISRLEFMQNGMKDEPHSCVWYTHCDLRRSTALVICSVPFSFLCHPYIVFFLVWSSWAIDWTPCTLRFCSWTAGHFSGRFQLEQREVSQGLSLCLLLPRHCVKSLTRPLPHGISSLPSSKGWVPSVSLSKLV